MAGIKVKSVKSVITGGDIFGLLWQLSIPNNSMCVLSSKGKRIEEQSKGKAEQIWAESAECRKIWGGGAPQGTFSRLSEFDPDQICC